MHRTTRVVLGLVSVSLGLSYLAQRPTQAYPRFQKKEGVSSCGYCHVKEGGGGARNYRGAFYQAHDNSFAGFDDAAEAKNAGVDVGPHADDKPASQTPPAAPGTPATPTTPTTPVAPPPLEMPPKRAPAQPADVAAPKMGKDGMIETRFQTMHDSFLARGKAGPIGVLFLGDSITEGWNKAKDVWEAHYGKDDVANFGIGGDKTQHVLWRIDNGELEGIAPKVVVLMIGTNNIGSNRQQGIIDADTKIVAEIHQKLPNTKVLLLGIFPRGDDPAKPAVARTRAELKAINAALSKLDDGGKTRFLDFGDKFLDANGVITKEMMPDALHPTAAGYVIWADAMQPTLDAMLK